ncbi:hypothetical protein Tco_0863488 [Tanacetum coccineum]
MLKRCEDTNLSLNWEKSHFMVKEGIVLGLKISKSGIEVDHAKVEVIAKLPHPTTVKDFAIYLRGIFIVNGCRPTENKFGAPRAIKCDLRNHIFAMDQFAKVPCLNTESSFVSTAYPHKQCGQVDVPIRGFEKNS